MFEFRDNEHEYNTLEAMANKGGSFVRLLSQLYRTGDNESKRKLREVFGNYFFSYSDIKTAEKPRDPKSIVSVTIGMNNISKDGKIAHHIHVEGVGSQDELEHLLMHLLADGKNMIGNAFRNIVKLGMPMTEEDARKILGDDIIEYVKHKAERAEPKLPN